MRRFGIVVAAALVACGCAADLDADTLTPAPTTTVADRPALPTTTTSPATTTTSTAATTTSTTTTVPVTTPPPLPEPAPPPAEDGSHEPRVELGSIEIPRIGLTRTMFEGIRLSTLDNGPGHWPGSAMPGEIGNVVVAGHRVSHNQDFRNLDDLQPGDEVIMSTATGRHVYRVRATEIVKPDAMWIIDQTAVPTATLFACHPPGSVSERIVVHLDLAT